MDSPHLQSYAQPSRVRTNSNLSVHSTDQRGGIRKRSLEKSRSPSTTQVDPLHQLALGPTEDLSQSSSFAVLGTHWMTPQHSPQLEAIYNAPPVEAFPTWSVPTPPRSDSGLPTVSIDAVDQPVTTCDSIHSNYHSSSFDFDPPTTSADMSSLGLLLPSQYGTGFESEPSSMLSMPPLMPLQLTEIGYTMEQSYMPPMKISQPTTTSMSGYSQTVSSNPSLYSSSRRHSELPSQSHDHLYGGNHRRISSPYDSSSGPYPSTTGQTIPSINGLTQSPDPSPHLSSTSGAGSGSLYNTSLSRSPSMYTSSTYPYTTASETSQTYAPAQNLTYPPPFVGSSEVIARPLGTDTNIRVLNQRPKPQCWEHGCNGRQFSTFSNLLRHQREKSGTAPKSYCPKCGAEFTRTTARNGHLAHDKCTAKPGQPSEDEQ